MPEWLRDWWAAIALVVTIALVPFVRWVWLMRRRDLVTVEAFEAAMRQAGEERRTDLAALKSEIRQDITTTLDQHDGRIDALGMRMSLAEAQVANLPTSDDVQKLTIQMTAVGGKLDVLAERLNGVNSLQDRLRHQVDVMDDFIRKTRP